MKKNSPEKSNPENGENKNQIDENKINIQQVIPQADKKEESVAEKKPENIDIKELSFS